MTGWRTWLANGLLVSASLLLTLGVAEGVVRLVAPQPTGLAHQDRYGLAVHYPGITRYMPRHGHEVSLNSVGMRDVEHTLQKPHDAYRILVLGDSFMEAFQVRFEQTMSNRVERALERSTGGEIEVINAGVSGWGTDDQLRYVLDYGLEYDPDLVLVAMTLHNDIIDNLRQSWHTLANGELLERPRRRMSFLQFKVVELKAFVAANFQLYQLYRRVRHGAEMRSGAQQLQNYVADLFRTETPSYLEQGYALTERLLGRLRDRAAESGARVVLVLIPLDVQVSESAFRTMTRTAGMTAPEIAPDKPQKTLLDIAERLDIPVIDLLAELRRRTAEHGESFYIEGDGHWNDAGHRVAAEIVSGQLTAWEILR